MRSLLGLAGWAAITFVAAALAALASTAAPAFYAELLRPGWAPPAWLFGPVWTTLYLLMALAAWLVWRRNGFRGARWGLALFLAQLAANALWSWLFFAWHRGAWAFADIVILWAVIVATIAAFATASRVAALLLAPYLAWVSFACALSYSVWKLNPAALG
jgi:tryptophan-rich sensory protein